MQARDDTELYSKSKVNMKIVQGTTPWQTNGIIMIKLLPIAL